MHPHCPIGSDVDAYMIPIVGDFSEGQAIFQFPTPVWNCIGYFDSALPSYFEEVSLVPYVNFGHQNMTTTKVNPVTTTAGGPNLAGILNVHMIVMVHIIYRHTVLKYIFLQFDLYRALKELISPYIRRKKRVQASFIPHFYFSSRWERNKERHSPPIEKWNHKENPTVCFVGFEMMYIVCIICCATMSHLVYHWFRRQLLWVM